jgi:cytochrome c-type biogenesis protein CcmF
MKPGQTTEISGYVLRFDEILPVQGPNFTENRARFSLLDAGGKPYGEIVSSKRFYPVRQMPTTEAGIRTMGVSQLYISLGDETADGALVVRIWWKPLVTLIWGGALVMMAGGAVSLLDRRLRVGAPARRSRTAAAKPEAVVS